MRRLPAGANLLGEAVEKPIAQVMGYVGTSGVTLFAIKSSVIGRSKR